LYTEAKSVTHFPFLNVVYTTHHAQITFTDQHLCTILCILDHILITAPVSFGLPEDGVNEHQNLLEQ